RSGERVGVPVERIREIRTVLQKAIEAALGEPWPEALQIVVAELIDGDNDDEVGPRGLSGECRMQDAECEKNEYEMFFHSVQRKGPLAGSGPRFQTCRRTQNVKRNPRRACQRDRRSATLYCRPGVSDPKLRVPLEFDVVDASR